MSDTSGRLRNLSMQTNRFFAYAVVMGEESRESAQMFNQWVIEKGLNKEPSVADVYDLWVTG